MKTNVSHANKMLRAAAAALTLTILPLLNSCDAVWGHRSTIQRTAMAEA